jgi:hypothetical protein
VGSCGSSIEFEARGQSAEVCLKRLGELFATGFNEEIDPRYAADASAAIHNGAGDS